MIKGGKETYYGSFPYQASVELTCSGLSQSLLLCMRGLGTGIGCNALIRMKQVSTILNSDRSTRDRPEAFVAAVIYR